MTARTLSRGRVPEALNIIQGCLYYPQALKQNKHEIDSDTCPFRAGPLHPSIQGLSLTQLDATLLIWAKSVVSLYCLHCRCHPSLVRVALDLQFPEILHVLIPCFISENVN